MGPVTRKLKIQVLDGQVQLCRLRCAHLEISLANAGSAARKEAIARRRDETLKLGHTAQLMLTGLEEQVKRGRRNTGSIRSR